MVKKGELYRLRSLAGKQVQLFVEVLRTWNHRDIDPDCPESVAIVGMVEIMVLTGSNIGEKQKYRSSGFSRKFERISAAE